MQIDGRLLRGHPLSAHGGTTVKSYEASVPLIPTPVLAAMATDFGSLVVDAPLAGATMVAFTPGDYIVTDVPATHAWVVKGNVFEAEYTEL
jgi:hypothetical protein